MAEWTTRTSAGVSRWLAGACLVWGLTACGSSDEEPVVGSGEVTSRTIDVMYVEEVTIDIPFKALVRNGDERQVVIRGEDNLIDLIEVTETDVSKYEISAPFDIDFEQHEDVEIEIPFIGMVSITVSGDVEFADQPFEVWDDENPMPGPGG